MELQGTVMQGNQDTTQSYTVVEFETGCFQKTREKFALQLLVGKAESWEKRGGLPFKPD
jgi:hypothetical protein